jgi:hypothetical protein
MASGRTENSFRSFSDSACASSRFGAIVETSSAWTRSGRNPQPCASAGRASRFAPRRTPGFFFLMWQSNSLTVARQRVRPGGPDRSDVVVDGGTAVASETCDDVDTNGSPAADVDLDDGTDVVGALEVTHNREPSVGSRHLSGISRSARTLRRDRARSEPVSRPDTGSPSQSTRTAPLCPRFLRGLSLTSIHPTQSGSQTTGDPDAADCVGESAGSDLLEEPEVGDPFAGSSPCARSAILGAAGFLASLRTSSLPRIGRHRVPVTRRTFPPTASSQIAPHTRPTWWGRMPPRCSLV